MLDLGQLRLGDLPPGDDVRRELKRLRDKVSPRLGDDPDVLPVAVEGEELVQALPQADGEALKVLVAEAAADVEQVEAVADVLCRVEDLLGPADRVAVEVRVGASGPDVEADADDVEAQPLRLLEQRPRLGQRGAKLVAEPAQAAAVVGEDAEDELGVGVEPDDLVELVGVVKRHHLDVVLGGVADERAGLARVRVDDPAGRHAEREHERDLGVGGAVETRPERGEQPQHVRVGVALDRCKGNTLVSS